MKKIIEIQFRKNKYGVFAVFPYEIFSGTYVTCYQHIGQHSGCVYYINKYSNPATDKEYESLLNELKGIYNDCTLKIINRRSHRKYLNALTKAYS